MPNDLDGSVLDAGNPEDAGATPASWNDDGYNELVTAKGWSGPNDVLESYVNLEKAVGADKVVLPNADTDLREWEGWSKLGTPDEASAYELNAPEGHESYDQGLSDWFREVAYENKMPASMAQAMHDKFVERMSEGQMNQSEQIDQQNDLWHTEMQTKFGTAFDERVAAANSAVREFGGEELRDVLNQANLGMHPVVINALSKIGVALGKGPQFKDSESSGQFGTTPEMAKEQIAAIRTNPGLMDASHPEHKVLNQKLTRLTELAYGTEIAS
tara:strand:+ start:13669 stop:14484 length:816 start_codon:yes stop_codon:yes gene_type:complete